MLEISREISAISDCLLLRGSMREFLDRINVESAIVQQELCLEGGGAFLCRTSLRVAYCVFFMRYIMVKRSLFL